MTVSLSACACVRACVRAFMCMHAAPKPSHTVALFAICPSPVRLQSHLPGSIGTFSVSGSMPSGTDGTVYGFMTDDAASVKSSPFSASRDGVRSLDPSEIVWTPERLGKGASRRVACSRRRVRMRSCFTCGGSGASPGRRARRDMLNPCGGCRSVRGRVSGHLEWRGCGD
jgi:hypothetical protein